MILRSKPVVYALLLLLWIVVASILLSSCYTPRKAQQQVTKAYVRYPEVVAGSCASFLPIRRFDSTITRYVQGKEVHDTSWVTVDCDSLLATQKREANLVVGQNQSKTINKLVRIPCPPATTRVDTFYQYRWVVQENTAALTVKDTTIARLNAALTQAKGEVVKKTSGRNAWRLVALIAIALIAGSLAIRFIKPRLIS